MQAWRANKQIPLNKRYQLSKVFLKDDPAAFLFAYLFGSPDLLAREYVPSKIAPILIFDTNMQYVTQIDDYEYLAWIRKWRRPHSFELHINRYKHNTEYLRKGYFIVINHVSGYRVGRIEHREITLDQDGKLSETWKILGKNISSFFESRLALHQTNTGSGYDVFIGTAEEAMRHYVNINCINPVDPNRVIPNLILGTNLSRGINVQYRARFQPIAQILEEISFISGLGYEVLFDIDDLKFVFEVLEGRDLTPGQSENPPVIFSPEFGNVKLLGYRDSELELKNVTYVAGQGEAAARMVIEVSEGNKLGFDRREVLIDARDLETTTQLEQRGRERLAEYSDEIVMEMEYTPSESFVYLIDFDLGDIVHTVYPGIGEMSARIIEVRESIDREGVNVTITLGNEWPDLVSVINREQKMLGLEVRR